jgi:GT2 family glycosyltransferase
MPELSIVIPTYRRPRELQQALAALPDGPEVIVVADAREESPPGASLQATRPGASAARNLGWQHAGGDVVLFLGDDVIAKPGLVEAHLAGHEAGANAVLGRVDWSTTLRVTPFMRFLDGGYQFDFDTLSRGEVPWWALYTANVSISRELLERSGGFDEEHFPFLYEDVELGYRLKDLGLRLVYDPSAKADHLHAPTLEEFQNRMRIIGAAERRMTEVHPEFPPYFKPRFEQVLSERKPAGLSGRLLRLLPGNPRVKASADARWTYALAESFMEGWSDSTQAPNR